jgi:hypothetical protein
MLERVAADLVYATEALAWEDKGLFQAREHKPLRMYFSVIVTTARLKVCVFDAEKISLSDGKLADASFDEVPFIRFRKQLSTRVPKLEVSGWHTAHARLVRGKEHTVFVVNADSLLDFLSQFSIDNASLMPIFA